MNGGILDEFDDGRPSLRGRRGAQDRRCVALNLKNGRRCNVREASCTHDGLPYCREHYAKVTRVSP